LAFVTKVLKNWGFDNIWY